jgi:Cd2+/Zn2+-exporting ATPase
MSTTKTYHINGIDCAVCAARIEDALGEIEGITTSEIDVLSHTLRIATAHPIDASFEDRLSQTISQEEPGVTIHTEKTNQMSISSVNRFQIPLRTGLSTLLAIIAWISGESTIALILLLSAYLISGYDVIIKAIQNLFRRAWFDEHFLMSIATLGAVAIGEYGEAVAVMVLYQVGEFFQDLAVHRSRKSIADAMDIQPKTATVIRDGTMLTVDPQELVVGDMLLIRPGDRIPVDAVVTEGISYLDTRALTGEAAPKSVAQGDQLISGSINGSGVLQAKAISNYADSTVAHILHLVEEAGSKKAQTERFITRFARYYTPIVVSIAALVAVIPPLLSLGSFSGWFYRALIFLVISCPCARMGILVKGGNALQSLAQTTTVVLDKTGTLTTGSYAVQEITFTEHPILPKAQLMGFAKSIEQHSHHPAARAIVQYLASTDGYDAHAIQEIPGSGITGTIASHAIALGNVHLMNELNSVIPTALQAAPGSVYLSVDSMVQVCFSITDTIKEEAQSAIQDLHDLGITSVSLLSGDGEEAVASVAHQVGIVHWEGSLLPQDKVSRVETLRTQKADRGTLLFAGDGINDAPVLALADVGVSMGKLGSDAAVEASDIVIMRDNLSSIPRGIRHARRTLTLIKQNIGGALVIKALVMLLGVLGYASMWTAVFADTGVALLAVINSLRALRKMR